MPVLEHEVHESVRHGVDKRYGCWNKDRTRQPVLNKNGWKMAADMRTLECEGVQRFKLTEDFGSLECRYDMSLKDGWCEGCKHRGSGEAYDRKIREAGK